MKVRLMFVPTGGGEIDYSLDFELPAIPQPGDYITVQRDGESGTEDFIVRRTWWYLKYPHGAVVGRAQGDEKGSVREIGVECEFATGPYSSESHKRGAGKSAKAFEDTAF